jgi:hypothetical protein
VRLGEVALALQVTLEFAGHHSDFRVLARELAKALHVVHHFGLREVEVQLLQADGEALELLAEEGFHAGLNVIAGGTRNPLRGSECTRNHVRAHGDGSRLEAGMTCSAR